MFSRIMFRHSATRLINRSSLTTTLTTACQRSHSVSRGFASTIKNKFLPGDWWCIKCGNHNFARNEECICGHGRKTSLSINSKNLPAPIGPYSHAVQTSFAVFVSGQLPADFEGNLVEGTMREKTEAVLKNLQEVLVTANSSLDKIVKVQVFLTDMKDFAEMNEEYEKWITHKPARSCVAVKELPKGVSIEIECIALP
ncbi:hypothetical protein OCU04_001615 [Sclerotinia nivalis]|uniref:RanBP2-type domain-containing protein n=1 Tax=Sclerotinia nivalis TaxID=352851 RepID=A0A9X0AYH7_9HELO|nr:hypothetical protein OCU04_001615 [Sclerotinia nivalis]